jgi:polar amino acid transport system substrate-binding protein
MSAPSRRDFLRLAAVAGLTLTAADLIAACGGTSGGQASASPEAATGLLAELRRTKSVKIGLPSEPPYSSLNPDGTVTGVAPDVVRAVMKRLGVPNVEGIVAPYADLIPGLAARRWDMIGASLTIRKARCAQVSFVDPIVFDGGCLGYLDSEVPNPPKAIADLASGKYTIGCLTGSYLIQAATKLGVPASAITQFPDNPSLVDGLMTKRVKVVLSTHTGVRDLQKAKNNAFKIAYPLADDPPHGSAPAIRTTDTALYTAFQRELAAIKKSGELQTIVTKNGFDYQKELYVTTADQACSQAA